MKKNIAVISGGNSGEFDISIQSGKVVAKYLDREKYNIYPIFIKESDWYFIDEAGDKFTIDKNDFSLLLDDREVKFDGVAVAIHGTPGEDGKLQGYFDMLKIPYTSCNHATSSLTFNKFYCKNFVKPLGIETANSIHLLQDNNISNDAILTKLSLPVFVKPNNGGSSVGMSKVNHPEDLEAAIQKAFDEDEEILLEEFVEGREITCGVFQSKGELTILPIAEIISKNDFFDFEAKYDPSLAEEVVPAQIPDEVNSECEKISAFLYDKLNCKGVVRFDYIFNKSGLYFLEVNTVPGMTETSIIPKMAKVYGLTLQQLFGTMVEEMFDK